MFLFDIRTPLYAAIYVAAIAITVFVQKRTPYSPKVDAMFGIKTKQSGPVESNFEELEVATRSATDTDDGISHSSKRNQLIGWGVWAVILVLFAIAGKTYMMQKNFNLFLVMLFAVCYWARRLLEKYA